MLVACTVLAALMLHMVLLTAFSHLLPLPIVHEVDRAPTTWHTIVHLLEVLLLPVPKVIIGHASRVL